MTTKKTPVKKSDTPVAATWTDREGNKHSVLAEDVTGWAETNASLEGSVAEWPDLPQRHMKNDLGGERDEDGRESLLDRNIILLEAVWKSNESSEYGPYFAVHALDQESGEFSFLSRGGVLNEQIGKLANIHHETGDPYEDRASEFPVATMITFIAGKGEYKGYYSLIDPRMKILSD